MASKEHSISSPSPYEIIFSCSVCQATISEIYTETESARGIRDGRSPHDRIVTKLWLTECAHLTCIKHLEGGGVPFHPEGEQPRASCPRCVTEKDDKRLKRLYAIRGCHEGEHDEQIPAAWFDTPPIKLDSSGPGMEALRFQYLQLIRYSTEMFLEQRQGEKLLEEGQENLDVFQRSHDVMENRIKDMKAEIIKLKEKEAELKRFKEKEPAIRHYLGVVSNLAKENDLLKEQLTILGYAVPKTNYAYVDDKNPIHTMPMEKATNGIHIDDMGISSNSRMPEGDSNDDENQTRGGHPESSSGYTMASSANPRRGIDCEATTRYHAGSPPRKKRVISDFVEDRHTGRSNDISPIRVDSRDLMPPPKLPLARYPQESPIRHVANYDEGESAPSADLQIYENKNWQSLGHPGRNNNTQTYSHTQARGSTAQVRSRTLERHYQTPRGQRETNGAPNMLSNSPTKTLELPARSSRQVDMPFLQRLDESTKSGGGYGYLSDAQYDKAQSYNARNYRNPSSLSIHDVPVDEEGTRIPQPDFSLPVTHQSPRRPLPRGHDFANREEYQRASSSAFAHGGDRNIFSPKTPAPRHVYDAKHQESVSSPFFKGTRQNNYVFARARDPLNEPQSVHQSFPEVLQGYKMAPAPLNRTEPRSLNGLSFINSPQDTMKEPFYESRNRRIADPRSSRLSLTYSSPRNEQRFFLRPNNSHSSFIRRETLSTLPHQSYSRQAATLPSSMPSSILDDRPLHPSKSFSNDSTLAAMGVKSGTVHGAIYPYTAGGSGCRYSPSRGLFSSTGGRRSVRR